MATRRGWPAAMVAPVERRRPTAPHPPPLGRRKSGRRQESGGRRKSGRRQESGGRRKSGRRQESGGRRKSAGESRAADKRQPTSGGGRPTSGGGRGRRHAYAVLASDRAGGREVRRRRRGLRRGGGNRLAPRRRAGRGDAFGAGPLASRRHVPAGATAWCPSSVPAVRWLYARADQGGLLGQATAAPRHRRQGHVDRDRRQLRIADDQAGPGGLRSRVRAAKIGRA